MKISRRELIIATGASAACMALPAEANDVPTTKEQQFRRWFEKLIQTREPDLKTPVEIYFYNEDGSNWLNDDVLTCDAFSLWSTNRWRGYSLIKRAMDIKIHRYNRKLTGYNDLTTDNLEKINYNIHSTRLRDQICTILLKFKTAATEFNPPIPTRSFITANGILPEPFYSYNPDNFHHLSVI